ncbi:RNA polymerase sigma factor [Leptospira sp. GIMC2001]|nr:RNA polymerase sigma factor [Leptospira sp. GIMC2001]WCL51375.1 RNA polymerase sigma factor [Leptospira sp. GIMC2001]
MQKTLNKEDILTLVASAGKGNPEAIKEFFDIYSEDIYNFPIRVFHLSEDDAGDFYIYAFERLKTGKRLQSFSGKSTFKTWFFSVLRNLLIDWKRTRKEVKIQSINKVNQEGKEYNTIEDEPDRLIDLKRDAQDFSESFYNTLKEIRLDNRVVFKLSYIYYLQLDPEEIQFIIDKSGMNLDELKAWIMRVRSELSEKEDDNQKMEDKITSIYLNILDLKEQKKLIDNTAASTSNLPDIDRLGQSLKKKYEQRKKLIDKRQKGHFLAKTPYREVSNILGISEGGVSVTLIRVIEKLQKKINFEEFT